MSLQENTQCDSSVVVAYDTATAWLSCLGLRTIFEVGWVIIVSQHVLQLAQRHDIGTTISHRRHARMRWRHILLDFPVIKLMQHDALNHRPR